MANHPSSLSPRDKLTWRFAKVDHRQRELTCKGDRAAKKQNAATLEVKLDVNRRSENGDNRAKAAEAWPTGRSELWRQKTRWSRFGRILIEWKWLVQERGDPAMLTLCPLERCGYEPRELSERPTNSHKRRRFLRQKGWQHPSVNGTGNSRGYFTTLKKLQTTRRLLDKWLQRTNGSWSKPSKEYTIQFPKARERRLLHTVSYMMRRQATGQPPLVKFFCK